MFTAYPRDTETGTACSYDPYTLTAVDRVVIYRGRMMGPLFLGLYQTVNLPPWDSKARRLRYLFRTESSCLRDLLSNRRA